MNNIFNWYQNSVGIWPKKLKQKLESRLLYGYPLFGMSSGLLQLTGIGDTAPAKWFSQCMNYIIPALDMAGLASPTPDRTRFFYAVMWLLAICITILLIPLMNDIRHEDIIKRTRLYPYKTLSVIPLFGFALYCLYMGLGTPTSLGNWKMYGSIGGSIFYGSMVMFAVPISLAAIYLVCRYWRITKK